MPAVYRIDRRENTPESRSSDNEASLVQSDSGTGVETRSSQPPLPPFFILSLFSATQLPSYVAFAYLFPCWTARMAVINRARATTGIRGIKRATCCCLHISISTYIRKKKKVSDGPFRQPHLQPHSSFVVSSSSFRSFSVLSSSSTYAFAFNPPVTRVIIGKPDVSAFSDDHQWSECNQDEKLAFEWKNIWPMGRSARHTARNLR